jgi:hypothetical protein
MRHRAWLGLAVVAIIVPLAAGRPWRPAVGAAPVVPGVALADIQLGTPIGEVLSRFGTPTVVRLTGANGLLGYGFDQYGITVYTRSDVVQAVATTNSVLGGVNGISLGTPASAVARAVGTSYTPAVVEGYPGVLYGGLGVAFGFDHGAVASILVFRPTGATPAQPTGPTQPGPVTTQTAPDAAAMASALQPGGAPAATGERPALPDISTLSPYTAATHFLSLSGYMRLLVHNETKTWISRAQGERLTHEGFASPAPEAEGQLFTQR